jgi:uncharacterized membrane protein
LPANTGGGKLGEKMKALILGLVVILAAVLSILPIGLGWSAYVIAFLRGALPVAAIFIGLILLFVGVSDIKERFDTKKENISEST